MARLMGMQIRYVIRCGTCRSPFAVAPWWTNREDCQDCQNGNAPVVQEDGSRIVTASIG